MQWRDRLFHVGKVFIRVDEIFCKLPFLVPGKKRENIQFENLAIMTVLQLGSTMSVFSVYDVSKGPC